MSFIMWDEVRKQRRFPLLNGLLRYWKLDETTGNRVDAVGGAALAPSAGLGYDIGKIGNAAKFTDTQLDALTLNPCPSDIDFAGAQSFTIAMWIYPYSLPTAVWTYHYLLAHVDIYASGADWVQTGYRAQVTYNNGIAFFVGFGLIPGSPAPYTHVYGIDPNNWYWILLCHDAVAKKAWVVNYPTNSTGVSSVAIPNGWFGCPAKPVTMGDGAVDDYDNDGLVDEVAFWNRLLTEDEKTWLYNSGAGRSYAEIAAYRG